MGKHLHFDCFNGISGDMTLGALVDLGVDIAEIERRLSGLPIGPFKLKAEKIKRAGIMGTRVHVEVQEDHHAHAHFGNVVEKVKAAKLSERTTERAIAAFRKIAEAEAHVHGSTVEKIHFHEVGAKDAILDVAGAMLGVELLGAETFSSSAVTVGSGTVKCAHGVMPVPAPATAEILKGVPTYPGEIAQEMTTPTGAAILRVLVGDSGFSGTSFRVEANGYGGGSREIPGHPNYLRLALGHLDACEIALPVDRQMVVMLETEMDDITSEQAGYAMEKLLASGALDVHFIPAQMKKNRPGHHLRVICSEADAERLAEIVLRETPTFGVRLIRAERLCLKRKMGQVQTQWGPIDVKAGFWGEALLKAKPEYESCRALAVSTGRPLAEILEAARHAISHHSFAPTPTPTPTPTHHHHAHHSHDHAHDHAHDHSHSHPHSHKHE